MVGWMPLLRLHPRRTTRTPCKLCCHLVSMGNSVSTRRHTTGIEVVFRTDGIGSRVVRMSRYLDTG